MISSVKKYYYKLKKNKENETTSLRRNNEEKHLLFACKNWWGISIFLLLYPYFSVKEIINLQKIDCAEFKRTTCNFQNGREPLFFLWNTLLIINDNGDQFCYCRFAIECLICKI